ncbi:MAG: cyclopropane-fatty-acyl-phospholipid synthase family protein [Caulobacteraceae bacterium]|nr:cyclopropane-fatty-acyl-phospholipid synthase family protein [Caulobacteraceae bacterium]
MSLTKAAIHAFQDQPMPDFVTRPAIAYLVSSARRRLDAGAGAEAAFAQAMTERPVAEHTEAANDQHYELPPEFFRLILGPRLKYSSCLYPEGRESLAEAEVAALTETCAHADLQDGQDILELGCGWGSLTLWMAERMPRSAITAVSNSASQRLHIEAEASRRGLANVRVITADMNDFTPQSRFDRIVSVEMFEHMANWRALLTRARSWLRPDGRMFLHVFTHRSTPYRFDHADRSDFIAQHFFTGGIMPSHGLIRQFPDLFEVEQEWRWSGDHYRRTAEAWLANFDRNAEAVDAILRDVYRGEARRWRHRWRLFFLATAGLFGDNGGSEWAVSHYRLRPAPGPG